MSFFRRASAPKHATAAAASPPAPPPKEPRAAGGAEEDEEDDDDDFDMPTYDFSDVQAVGTPTASSPGGAVLARRTSVSPGTITGTMAKQGGMIKTWKVRFFSMNTKPLSTQDLRPYIEGRLNITKQIFQEIKDNVSKGGGLLFYYKSASGKTEDIKGIVNLRGCDGVIKFTKGQHGTPEYPFALQILVPKQRSFIIAASSQQEQDMWVAKMQEVIKNLTEAYLVLRKFATNADEDPDSFIWA